MEINETLIKTKIDNIFVKLYTGMTIENLRDVKHFLSDEVYEKYESILEENKKKNQKQIYDEINVKNSRIVDVEEQEDKTVIHIELISRYMDYILDNSTGKIIFGTDQRRIEKRNDITLEKKNDTKEIDGVRKCPSCGASMSINKTGVCEFCHQTYPLERISLCSCNLVFVITTVRRLVCKNIESII